MAPDHPSHIVGSTAASWTLCGIRVSSKEALPYTLSRYVDMNIAGRGAVYCETCMAERAADAAAPKQLTFDEEATA